MLNESISFQLLQHVRVANSNIPLGLSDFIDKTCELIHREFCLFGLASEQWRNRSPKLRPRVVAIGFYEGYLQSFIYRLLHLPNLVQNYLLLNLILFIILQLRCYLVEYRRISRGKQFTPRKEYAICERSVTSRDGVSRAACGEGIVNVSSVISQLDVMSPLITPKRWSITIAAVDYISLIPVLSQFDRFITMHVVQRENEGFGSRCVLTRTYRPLGMLRKLIAGRSHDAMTASEKKSQHQRSD